MIVCLVSSFRNSSRYLDRYIEQVAGLQTLLHARGDALTLRLGHGDSSDGTHGMLHEAVSNMFSAWIVDVSHGGPAYGSVEDAQRFRQLAYVANRLSDTIPAEADAVLWVESDLIWEPATLVALLDRLADYPAVAPMLMDGEQSFYDVYAYRRGGVRFTKEPPFHPDINGAPLRLDSAGSCVAVRGDLGRSLRWPAEDVFVGWCRALGDAGGAIFLEPGLRVEHVARK